MRDSCLTCVCWCSLEARASRVRIAAFSALAALASSPDSLKWCVCLLVCDLDWLIVSAVCRLLTHNVAELSAKAFAQDASLYACSSCLRTVILSQS